MAKARLRITAFREDGSTCLLAARTVEGVADLMAEAQDTLRREIERGTRNETRVVRDSVPLTVTVRVDLVDPCGQLIDREEATR